MKGLLRILSGENERGVIDLETGTYAIGRDDSAEIKIDSRQVSRKHAQLVVEKDVVRLIDSGSANGTNVNGKAVKTTSIQDGDRIQVGDIIFEYQSKRIRSNSPIKPNERDIYTIRNTKLREPLGRREVIGKKPSRTFLSFRTVLVLTLSVVMGALVALTGLTARSLLRDYLAKEVLARGQWIAKYVAEKNKEELRVGNDLLLDVESIAREKGVREVTLVNRKGRILAPSSRLSQIENDPYVAEVLSQATDHGIISTEPFADGSYIFVHPIRVYNEKLGVYETLGAAKVLFAPESAVSSVANLNHFILILFLISIFSGIALAYLFSGMVSKYLLALAESIDSYRTEGEKDLTSSPFQDWQSIFEAVDKILEEPKR